MQRYAWKEKKEAGFGVKCCITASVHLVMGGCLQDVAVKVFGGVLCLDLDGLGCWVPSHTPAGPDSNTARALFPTEK